MSEDGEALILEQQSVEIRDGELTDQCSWVYVWTRPGEPSGIVYVGATTLPPVVRTWLHLHHDNPNIGRVRVNRPDALSGDLIVHAFRLHPSCDRHAVKDVVIRLLDTDEPDLVRGDDRRVRQAALVIASRVAR